MTTSETLVLRQFPQGRIGDDTFEVVSAPVAAPADGEVTVASRLISIDPTMRVWLDDARTYMDRLAPGDVMRAIAIGEVEASRSDALPVGTLVLGLTGCRTRATVPAASLQALPDIGPLPLDAHFGLLGHIGMTAWCGLTEIGQLKAGETLVVSAAAGAVGSLAVQVGKLLGCRVIGIAGGADKCRHLTEVLGIDAAIDYRSEDVAARLGALCPDSIDVYFDNVGGAILEAALEHMALFGRIVACGMISAYNRDDQAAPRNLLNVVTRRLRMEGFVILDARHDGPAAYRALLEWAAAGRIQYRVHAFDGLARIPDAINTLFDGNHHGKVVVRVG
ncbi:MAG: NADP-dependent oxidoreductase [Rhodocyclaceae bacterium]|nr:NADP-dependent oxidoreductase [Rhodocyclaceae bacterium]